MKHGLQDDPLFVLKASWTNSVWRETLNTSCPELWVTLSSPDDYFDDEETREEMAEAWIQRSGGRFHTIVLRPFEITSVNQNANSYLPLFASVKRFKIIGGDKCIRQLLQSFEGACDSLEHLALEGYEEEGAWETRPFQNPHCGFLKTSTSEKIQSMRLSDIDFRQPSQGSDNLIAPPYHALEYLVSDGCLYDEVPRRRPSTGGYGSLSEFIRVDPLHQALRTCVSLRHLKVAYPSPRNRFIERDEHRNHRLQAGKNITLHQLQTAVLPPPAIQTLDIETPNLTALSFETSFMYRYSLYPMIPTIEESPVPLDQLSKLKYIGFACSSKDALSRLEQWIPHLTSVTRIAFRGGQRSVGRGYSPHPEFEPGVQLQVVQALAGHPEWLPALQHLQLSYCYVPESVLFSYLAKRRRSTTVASIARIDLSSCSDVEEEVCQQRGNDVEWRWEWGHDWKLNFMAEEMVAVLDW